MKVRAPMANFLLCAAGLKHHRRFVAALDRPREVQEGILRATLRRNQDSHYGRTHKFDTIRSVREYQERVPPRTFDEYQPSIDRIAAGEAGVLTHEPVVCLQPTSGSTRSAKWVPYTSTLQSEFRCAVAAWVLDVYLRRPSLLGGPAYWSVSPAPRSGAIPGNKGRASGDRSSRRDPGPAHGFHEDSASLGKLFQRLIGGTLAVPSIVRHAGSMDEFRRLTLLFLLISPDLRLISVWHPTYLTLLMEPLVDSWGELLSAIEHGFPLPGGAGSVPGHHRRARELARLDPSRPSALWPNLGMISCWGDSHARLHLDDVRRLFPQAEIQAKGLIATECCVSIPFRGEWPLAVTSHFFEFQDHAGGFHLPWEVEIGEVYSLVVTTGGGLYRYRLRDQVEITGHLGATPCLRFVAREDVTSDLCGEKISEGFAGAAIQRALQETGLQARFALLAPHSLAPAGYTFYVESDKPLPRQLASVLENALRDNPHYDHCLRLGQLAPVRVVRIADRAYQHYVRRLFDEGQRVGDIKPAPLSLLRGWDQAFPPFQEQRPPLKSSGTRDA